MIHSWAPEVSLPNDHDIANRPNACFLWPTLPTLSMYSYRVPSGGSCTREYCTESYMLLGDFLEAPKISGTKRKSWLSRGVRRCLHCAGCQMKILHSDSLAVSDYYLPNRNPWHSPSVACGAQTPSGKPVVSFAMTDKDHFLRS